MPRYINVTDGRTDGQTDGRLTIAIPRFALLLDATDAAINNKLENVAEPSVRAALTRAAPYRMLLT